MSNISLKVQLFSCFGGLFRTLQVPEKARQVPRLTSVGVGRGNLTKRRLKLLKNNRRIKCPCDHLRYIEKHLISAIAIAHAWSKHSFHMQSLVAYWPLVFRQCPLSNEMPDYQCPCCQNAHIPSLRSCSLILLLGNCSPPSTI